MLKNIMQDVGVNNKNELIRFMLYGSKKLPKFNDLTRTENKVLNFYTSGSTAAEVAKKLNRKIGTVLGHMTHIREKTGVGKVMEALVLLARKSTLKK
jgi:DNA-binding CsgD family transcriptional regulator